MLRTPCTLPMMPTIPRVTRACVTLVITVLVVGCRPATPTDQPTPATPSTRTDAVYVWQHDVRWPIQSALAQLPPSLTTAKVLVRDDDTAIDWSPYTLSLPKDAALVLVWRMTQQLADLQPLVELADDFRQAGVTVKGIEVDHDCPTSKLSAYASFLQAQRARVPVDLELLITALPTWAEDAAALHVLHEVVDGITLQVHMVRHPVLFDEAAARSDIDAYVRVLGVEHLAVALPSYRMQLADGVTQLVEPARMQRFGAEVAGRIGRVVWFRLGSDEDHAAMSGTTLDHVVGGRVPACAASVVQRVNALGSVDVDLHNLCDVDVVAPLRVDTTAHAGVGIRGYSFQQGALVTTAPHYLRPRQRVTIGAVAAEVP
jgi:uncharacterized protein YceK